MCGITGFWGPVSAELDELRATARKMAVQLRHRGPDDEGTWADHAAGIAFGFCRLAIIDLTPEGRQPMTSESGRFVIAYNGEVYNFQHMRSELEPLGHKFRGSSDTEVMLAAIEEWDLEGAVERFNGMFAFALWDRRERKLHLVRDRLGIKPLYYGWANQMFLFGSELKAIKAHPEFKADIDHDALTLFLRHNYIPTPWSIYKSFFKLPPGSILTLRSPAKQETTLSKYWSAKEIAERGINNPFLGSEMEAKETLETLLLDSVELRMISDVPLGAFLSGGVDSSTIVALMQAQSNQPVRTFSVGFYENDYNEALYAKKVAGHLGTEHTELYITPEEAREVIQRLPKLYDEPFSDSSQIPTFLISELARQHVTVSLSGDGGDELFGGYNRYFWGRAIWHRLKVFPVWLRKWGAKAITSLSPKSWDNNLTRVRSVLPSRFREPNPGDKLHKLAEVLAVDSPEALYHGLVSHWKHPEDIVVKSCEPETVLTDRSRWAQLPDFTQRMMYFDLISYLPDDILTKVDRASMGVSLEARVPLLDHRVVEFAWSLPLSMKVGNDQGKLLLRQVLYKYVPKELIERPKMGFAIPIDAWLRGPLRDWAENLLDERRLRLDGFFNPAPIRKKWKEHQSGGRNWQYYLWDVLMFQAWLEAE